MMGLSDPQPALFYQINLEQFVTVEYPLRKIRPVVDIARIRHLCTPQYADIGRPSFPPEPVVLALVGG